MSNSTVRRALETRLHAWASSQSLPIAHENEAFTKPTAGVWLECFLIPNTTSNRETTAQHARYRGLFQVNVWGEKGEGLGILSNLADSLVGEFPVVPKVGGVSIEKPPHIGRPILDDSGWIALPVLMSYRFEA